MPPSRWPPLQALRAHHIYQLDKDYVVVHSDSHGSPPLVAEHGAPTASGLPPPDALDFYGFWKWFDALTDAAWYGTGRKCLRTHSRSPT